MMITITTLLAASTLTIGFPMEATVQGTEIELGEVAAVVGEDPALVARARSIELGYAPAPGYTRLLLRERVARTLERKLVGVTLRFEGEEACRVRPDVVSVAPEELRAVANAELVRRRGGADASFVLRDPIGLVEVPRGTAPPTLRVRGELPELASGVVSVPVEILVEGVVYRTVFTTWTADVYHTVPVLVTPVASGQELRADMLERQRMRLERGPRQKPLTGGQLSGAVAARDLPAGTIVTDSDVHRPVVINIGQRVFLRVRKGGIEATAPAQALESGAIGDRVRVPTLDSSQEVLATVIGRDVVRVDLGARGEAVEVAKR